jgi:ATP-dependent DNA helicase DinG
MSRHASRDAQSVVDLFKRMRAPRVLVSPSMETGWDFPYDECRYQIIAKVPFVDTRSAVIRARHKSDKKYLNYVVALTLIQMVGRGMRASDDWCETLIIDDNIRWFWAAAREFFPAWFRAAYKVHNRPDGSAPAPLDVTKAVAPYSGGIRTKAQLIQAKLKG